eukprot:3310-Heterococcus_DN1.PRE.1
MPDATAALTHLIAEGTARGRLASMPIHLFSAGVEAARCPNEVGHQKHAPKRQRSPVRAHIGCNAQICSCKQHCKGALSGCCACAQGGAACGPQL